MKPKRTPLLAFLIALAIAALSITVSAQDVPVTRVGVLGAERGAVANGARLAVQAINDTGGITTADGTQSRLELVYAPTDGGLALTDAVDALLAAEVVAVLGPETDAEVIDGLTDLQRLGVPVITTATGDTILTSDTSGAIFRARAAEALQGRALANYLIGEYELTDVATVQLDVDATASMIGFMSAATALGVTPQASIILQSPDDLDAIAADLLETNPAVVVAYGAPALAASLYTDLRVGAWEGVFAYNQAVTPAFRVAVPPEQLTGVVAAMTWSFTSSDDISTAFLDRFIRTYGELPGAVEAAAYDAVTLLAEALNQPGSLSDNLAASSERRGVQGILNAEELGARELSNNVAIIRLSDYGAPIVLARYVGSDRLPEFVPVVPGETPTPAPTATPVGVVLTITQSRQNVRMGPSTDYPTLGQLNEGEQVRVLGMSSDQQWAVIDFLGEQGWIAAYLAEISGDPNSVPIVSPPPIPTPVVTATPVVPPTIDLIIDSVAAVPSPILPNQSFTVNVTVRNIGTVAAGTFAVAGTFPPNNVYLIGQLPGLPAGQSAVVQLNGVLTAPGTYTAAIVVDPNNQVIESPEGELNNTYNFTYQVGQSVLNQGTQTLNLGDTLDLEGNAFQGDVNWNSDDGTLGLKAIFGARLGILGGDFNAFTAQNIDPAALNRDSIARTELSVGSIVGISTADGHRGVMLVSAISDTQISLTYKVFN